jgi:ankyrin repeat protein
MYDAASNGQVQAMQLLLQHGAHINGNNGTPWKDKHYRVPLPPLERAVAHNQVTAIQWMLEQGADAGPALSTAAGAGNLPIVCLLLESGADVATWGGGAFSAAMKGQSEGRDTLEVVLLLLASGPTDYFMPKPDSPLAPDHFLRHVKSFLHSLGQHKAATLLQAAVQHGHTEFAQMLLREGVAVAGEVAALAAT